MKLDRQALDHLGLDHPGLDHLRLDHLGIAVRSIDQAKRFYALLGMIVTHEETVEHEGVHTAMMPLGDTRVELLEPMSPDTVIGRFLDKRGEGMHHMAVAVDDIETIFAEMRSAGVRLVSTELKRGAGGHQYFFVHPSATGGVLLEVVQPQTEPAP